MKRDWVRIKNLLVAIEGEENTLSKYLEWWTDEEYKARASIAEYETIKHFKLKAKERMLPVIKHHLELMRDDGLIDGECDFDDLEKSTVRLTSKGYKLLDCIRCDLFDKVQQKLNKHGEFNSVSLMIELTEYALKQAVIKELKLN